ncbi:hypothetical protein BGZ96_009267 [Linnemannia gamsii]|uniref:Uncharacterized protein n=1 Tax=Linnemannia gamsii TaxID=64522 RepID=A0ABQ7JWI3_9FUNG|nr:hypothetical protein BGZ96_009267 [Linnemannia gamsii]
MAWSLLCSMVILSSFLTFLSPSTGGGRALAALEQGFCGDCQTFSNAIGVCGGTFTAADIEVPTEYVLNQLYAKCTCTAVMQTVLWNCAKCEFLAGHGSKGVPPKKHKMTCLAWGITNDAYNAPYTGVVAPGTVTDVNNPNPPPVPEPTITPKPTTTGSPKPSTTTGGGNNSDGGDKPSGTSSSTSNPSNSQDSLNGDKNASGSSSGPNTAAIGISVGIIGVAFIAGVMAVVMMKRRRRRRRSPLDLDDSPALANFAALDDKWENKANRPMSPPLPPAPIASATPVVGGGRGNGRGGYGEGSVVGGYDAQYDAQYDDQYGYGHGHHGGGGSSSGGGFFGCLAFDLFGLFTLLLKLKFLGHAISLKLFLALLPLP